MDSNDGYQKVQGGFAMQLSTFQQPLGASQVVHTAFYLVQYASKRYLIVMFLFETPFKSSFWEKFRAVILTVG